MTVPHFRILANLASGMLLTSCGAVSPTVNLKVLTNLGHTAEPAKNLMSAITTQNAVMLFTGGSTCTQPNLYAGTRAGGDLNEQFTIYPVGMQTPRTYSGGTDIASWIASNATYPSIDIPVPKGATVDIGVIGSIISETTNETADICTNVPASGSFVNPTYSVIGHQDGLTLNADTSIDLNVWIVAGTGSPANPTGIPCTANDSAHCPVQDYELVELQCSPSCPTSFNGDRVRFEYFAGSNRPDHPVQVFPTSAFTNSPSYVALPQLQHIMATLVDTTGPLPKDLGSVDLDRAQIDPNTKSATYSFMAPNGGSTITYTFIVKAFQ